MHKLLSKHQLLKSLLCAALIIVAQYVSAAGITKSGSSPQLNSVCPVVQVGYTVTLQTNCTASWIATNGVIIGSNTGGSVTVVWTDTPGAIASIKCTVTCPNGSGGTTSQNYEMTETILSVFNQPLLPFTTAYNVDYCNPTQLNLSVQQLFVSGTGNPGQPPLVEAKYQWSLPTGWKTVAGETGIVSTPTNHLSIVPVKCAVSGTVSVVAHVGQCGSGSKSNPVNIAITSNASPSVNVSPQGAYSGGSACNTTPVTFAAAASPGCVTSYTWTAPASWTRGAQTGNTIVFTPSGKKEDAGLITCVVKYTCGTEVTASFPHAFTKPTVAGPDLVCTTGTFTLQNAPGATVTWTSSYPAILSINPTTGVATKGGTTSGAVTIRGTFACGADYVEFVTWAGIPSLGNIVPLYQSNDGTKVCANQYTFFNYTTDYLKPAQLTFEWTFSPGTINQYGGQYIQAYTPGPGTTITINARAINACGGRTRIRTFIASSSIDGQFCFDETEFSVYPNPAVGALTVESSETYSATGEGFKVEVVNESGTTVLSQSFSGKTATIDREQLKPGMYLVNIYNEKGERIEQKRVAIK